MRERTPFPRGLISHLPNLKLLLTTGERNASFDLDACAACGISVTGTPLHPPGVSATASSTLPDGTPSPDSTTEHCVSMMLALARGLARDDRVVKTGAGWQTGWATCMAGKTVAMLGLGRIGTAVARIMRVAFGMTVIAWSPNLTQERADEQAAAAGLATRDAHNVPTFCVVSREELFQRADIMSVHMVLSDRSRGLVTAAELSMMKSTAFLVNTSRGPLVVEDDLFDALEKGTIAGAALDVFDVEPLPHASRWRTTAWGEDGRADVLLAPHMGYVDKDTFEAWYSMQADNVERWLAGQELHTQLRK